MCQLIETIRIENGEPSLLTFHQERMDRARKELMGLNKPCSLSDCLSTLSIPHGDIWKCRVTYGAEIEKVEFETYQKRAIHTLRIVVADDLIYDHKYANRSEINKLYDQREGADDVLFIRNNLLTDTSYCNIALWDGSRWVTPLQPFLKGVRRASLILMHALQPADIKLNDLSSFFKIRLLNAMIPFDEAFEIPVQDVLF
jgi:4-amino-4-deoxychorismate lyase